MLVDSPYLVEDCPHFPRCGGCQTLDWPYPQQLAQKQEILEKLFGDLRGLEIKPIMGCENPMGYRHKVQLPFGWDAEKGQVLVGCYGKGSHQVIDQKSCWVQDPELSGLAYAFRQWAQAEALPIYAESQHSGNLRHLILRKGFGTGEMLAGVVMQQPEAVSSGAWDRLLAILKSTLGNRANALKTLVALQNKAVGNTVLMGSEKVIWGRGEIEEKLDGLEFRLRANTFFQVNPQQAIKLFTAAVEFLTAGERVLDLYCGTGTLTQWAARKTGFAEGWESNAASIAAAKLSAATNGLSQQTLFEVVDIPERLRSIAASAAANQNKNWSTLILDPPRKGLEDSSISALLAWDCHRITYVSCNPNSLRRDWEKLKEKYQAVSLQPVDMMPQTRHLECVLQLVKR